MSQFMIKENCMTGRHFREEYNIYKLKQEKNISELNSIIRQGSDPSSLSPTRRNRQLVNDNKRQEEDLKGDFDWGKARQDSSQFDKSKANIKTLLSYLTAELKPQPFFGSEMLKPSIPMPTRSGKKTITGESVLEYLIQHVGKSFNIDHAMQIIAICTHRNHRPLLNQKYTDSAKNLLHKLGFSIEDQKDNKEILRYQNNLLPNRLFQGVTDDESFNLVNKHFNNWEENDKNQTFINKVINCVTHPEAKGELESLLAFLTVFLRTRYSANGAYYITFKEKREEIYVNYDLVFKYLNKKFNTKEKTNFTKSDAAILCSLCVKRHPSLSSVTAYTKSVQTIIDGMAGVGRFLPSNTKLSRFKHDIDSREIRDKDLSIFLDYYLKDDEKGL